MDAGLIMIALGAVLLVGMAADEIGHRTRLPRVTLLMLVGFVAGKTGLDVLPEPIMAWADFLAKVALGMVAFLLGGRLTREKLFTGGPSILVVSLAVVAITTAIVAGGFALLGFHAIVALVLAAIATATDPAAVKDVVQQTGARGPFTDRVLGIVAVDDLWGILIFAVMLIVAGTLNGVTLDSVISDAFTEIFGAVALGVAVGLPAAWLTGRISPGDPTQAEALGVVFLTTGLAIWLGVSFLLAGIVAGAVVANLARHHSRPFHEVEHIEWPFMIFFFVLAGATLESERLADIGVAGAAYIGLRIISRLAGGAFGAKLAGLGALERQWLGPALLPQAGVAIGMALVAEEQFPDLELSLLTVAVSTTIVFELIGPILTQEAFYRTGEAPKPGAGEE
ncbi:cation:proton antiporter [Rhizobiales bacterium]|uniref:cation:proton antiporter n=1 Tax=Hongsoonwoonella zoysiae TaxID=2821844 RepID=UPI00156030A8|nr:cation:proton antiporter [Hongsoonwoonella zoysiae]NRG19970.1 cation:proton antiporter [Hongsoonwoonella zoysiae]